MRVRRFARKLAVAAATLLVVAVGAELTARALEPGPFSLWDRNPYRPDPVLDHVHRPDFRGRWDGTWYATDALGLRGPARPAERSEGEFRVVCLGDSCTFGKGVSERDTWPRQLESMLESALPDGSRPVVFNLGVNGYDGSDYREMLDRIGIELDPDLVVVGYNLNDFPNAIRAVDRAVFDERGLRKLLSKGLRDALGRLAIYRTARAWYYDWNREGDWARAERFARGAGGELEDVGVWEEQRAHLAALAETARAHGARVAVFLFPYESQIHLETYDTSPIERLGSLCDDLDVPFVSLAETFRRVARSSEPPRELFLRGDRYHPRPEGHALVAREVLELARDEGWLDAPTRPSYDG